MTPEPQQKPLWARVVAEVTKDCGIAFMVTATAHYLGWMEFSLSMTIYVAAVFVVGGGLNFLLAKLWRQHLLKRQGY